MNLRARLARLEAEEEAGARRIAEYHAPRIGRSVEELLPEARRARAMVRMGLAGRYPPSVVEAILESFEGGGPDLRDFAMRQGVDPDALLRDILVATGCPREEVDTVIARHREQRDRGYTSVAPSGVHQGDRA